MRSMILGACLVLTFTASAAPQAPVDDYQRRKALQHYRSGVEHLSGEEWDNAVTEFRAAVAIDALFTDAYYGLGQAHMGQRRYVSAALAFESCLAAARKLHLIRERDRVLRDRDIDDQLHELRDTMHRMAQQGGSRLEKYASDLERRRSSIDGPFQAPPAVLLSLGSAHFRNGDAGRAEYYWREAVHVDDSFGQAWNNLAAIYAQAGRRDAAVAALASAERTGYRVNPQLKEEIKKLQ